ncbi:MAG: biopolymer transporter ExbD [Bacteroidetes bacterium]|nr:biopolymer transporter ExbD [Bacteroidota bacterium]
MAKGKSRPSRDVNGGSLADIAFLMLLFFLMTTTMDIDKGLNVKLPPLDPDAIIEVDVEQRNVWSIAIDSRDRMLVEDKLMRIEALREATKEFLANPFQRLDLAISPEDAVVSLKNDRGTSYDFYVQVQNELKAAYNELRDDESLKRYGKKYGELVIEQKRIIKDIYPIRISEAEPEDLGGE